MSVIGKDGFIESKDRFIVKQKHELYANMSVIISITANKDGFIVSNGDFVIYTEFIVK